MTGGSARARDALEAMAEAESSVGRRRGEPSGALRLVHAGGIRPPALVQIQRRCDYVRS